MYTKVFLTCGKCSPVYQKVFFLSVIYINYMWYFNCNCTLFYGFSISVLCNDVSVLCYMYEAVQDSVFVVWDVSLKILFSYAVFALSLSIYLRV